MNERGKPENDQAIVRAIRSGGDKRLAAIEMIYSDHENKKRITAYLLRKGARREDAEDLYQDAIIVFQDRLAKDNDFELEASIRNYIFGICKLKWLNARRKTERAESARTQNTEQQIQAPDPQDLLEKEERKKRLQEILDQMDGSCKELLTLWMLEYEMKEIMEIMNFSSLHMVRKAKYRCLKRLRLLIREDPRFKSG